MVLRNLIDAIRRAWETLRFRLGRARGVYYVHGPDLLPTPLDAEEEKRAIEDLAGENRESARALLIERNLRLVVYIARKFESSRVGAEDLISIGTLGLIKAINTFCADRQIKLATYASRCIENEILMYLRKIANRKCEVSIDEPLSTDWDGNELLLSDIIGSDEEQVGGQIEKREECETVRRAVARLGERERQIIEMRYGLGGRRELTQKEVADLLGISQSYISRIEKKIMARLKCELADKV